MSKELWKLWLHLSDLIAFYRELKYSNPSWLDKRFLNKVMRDIRKYQAEFNQAKAEGV